MKIIIATEEVHSKDKPEKDRMNQLSENTFVSDIRNTISYTGNMELNNLKSEQSPENGNSFNSHEGLIEKFDNLDLTDTKPRNSLQLDKMSNKGKSEEYLDSITNKPKENEDSLIDINSDVLVNGNRKSERCAKIEHLLAPSTVDLLNVNTLSTLPKMESKGKVSCFIFEDDLTAYFSELRLNEKQPCNDVSYGTEISNKETSGDDSSPEILLCGREQEKNCLTNQMLKSEKIDLLSLEEIHEDSAASDAVAKKNLLDHISTKKYEVSSENELVHLDNEDDQSDEELMERTPCKKTSNDPPADKNVRSGRIEKTPKVVRPVQLKSSSQLHMSGSSVINGFLNETSDITSVYYDLLSLGDPLYEISHLTETSPQASYVPLFFDQSTIDPIKPSVYSGNSCSLTPSYSDGDLLGDALSPVLSASNFWPSLPAECSTLSGTKNQENSNQYTNTSNSLLDIFSCDELSPCCEMPNCHEQNSRSVSPESGYGSPGLSAFSDDSSDLSRFKDQSSDSLSPSTEPVHDEDESLNNLDLSIFDDYENSIFWGHQNTEEEEKIISEIKCDLKKCEENCKLEDSYLLKNVCNEPSMEHGNTQGVISGVSASQHSTGYSTTIAPLQQDSPNVTPPQVVIICLPYNVQTVDKGQKKLLPIRPKLQEQSSKQRLVEKLDYKKVMHHLYKLLVKMKNNGEHAIYMENEETRQTNLHSAVKNQDIDRAFCILEVHKKCKKNKVSKKGMPSVNSRDVYKKTALQYAVSNAMTCGAPEACTLFLEYLRSQVDLM